MSRASDAPPHLADKGHHAAPPPSPAGLRQRFGRAAVHLLFITTLPLLTFGLYARSLDAPFFFDDQTAVVFNELIQHPDPPTRLLASNRPLTEASLAWNYAHAGLQPRSYHLLNILLHALTTVVVYGLAYRALTAALAARYAGVAPALAGATALLFALHPLQTESVCYVSSRSEILATLFYLLTLFVYATAAASSRGVGRVLWALALPVTTAAALGSKETAATVPVALVLYDWCFISAGSWRRLRQRWPYLALVLLPFTIGFVVIFLRDLPGKTAGFSFQRFTAWQYLLSQFGVLLHYLRLTVVPVGLCMDTEWPLARTFWTPAVAGPFILLAGAVLLALRLRRTLPVVTFGVLWFFVTLAPSSSIVPIADLVAERRMYPALFGLALLASVGLWDGIGRLLRATPRFARLRPLAFGLVMGLAVTALGLLTTARVRVWLGTVSLYEDTVAKAPDNPRARLNLASAYLFLGRVNDAEPQLNEAERLYQEGTSIHAFDRIGAYINVNLCNLYYLQGHYDAAASRCQRALQIGGRFIVLRPLVFLYLGHIASARQQWDAAIRYYTDGLAYASGGLRLNILLNIARTHLLSGHLDAARTTLDQVLKADPNNQDAARMLQAFRRVPPQ